MNKKGFTIVELVATIALLAIISVISFISINAIVDESKISECDALVNNIKSATKEYISDNRYNLDEISSYMIGGNDKEYRFSVSVLLDEKKLSSPVINPFDDNEATNDVTDSTLIEVSLNGDYTVNEVVVKNSSGSVVNCEGKNW